MPLCDKDNIEPTIKELTRRVEDSLRRVVAMGHTPTAIQAYASKKGTLLSVCYVVDWHGMKKKKWISFPNKAPAE